MVCSLPSHKRALSYDPSGKSPKRTNRDGQVQIGKPPRLPALDSLTQRSQRNGPKVRQTSCRGHGHQEIRPSKTYSFSFSCKMQNAKIRKSCCEAKGDLFLSPEVCMLAKFSLSVSLHLYLRKLETIHPQNTVEHSLPNHYMLISKQLPWGSYGLRN